MEARMYLLAYVIFRSGIFKQLVHIQSDVFFIVTKVVQDRRYCKESASVRDLGMKAD